MSYDKELAERPLSFGETDIVILTERERKHIIMSGDLGILVAMKTDEYIELRGKYIEAVNEIERLKQRLELAREQRDIAFDKLQAPLNNVRMYNYNQWRNNNE